MGPVSCLIIQDDPPTSGGQEAKYTGGLNIKSCDVVLCPPHSSPVQGWTLPQPQPQILPRFLLL